jgi:hypothetical protein
MTKYTNASKGNNPKGGPGETNKVISLPKIKQKTKSGIVTGKGGPQKTGKPSG